MLEQRFRDLGHTGLRVSAIALGTVELGMDYGFRGSPEHRRRPELAEAIRILERAAELGINLLDTARAYGDAEERIGQALPHLDPRPLIAGKVSVAGGAAAFWESLHASLRALRVPAIDILQMHDPPPDLAARGEIFEWFEQARQQGKVRFAGASFYDEAAAWAALDHGAVATLQVPFNLLDQKMGERVIPRAEAAGRGVLARSVFLRGVLTAQVETLPPALAPLRDAARRALHAAGETPARLSELALRFCLSQPGVSSVIVGVRSAVELEANVETLARGPLPPETLRALAGCSLGDSPLVNPLNWQGLI